MKNAKRSAAKKMPATRLKGEVSEAFNELIDKDLPSMGIEIKKKQAAQKYHGASVQGILPYVDVTEQGTVITTDGGYFRIMEVAPSNFALASQVERDDTIAQFANLFKYENIKNIRIKTIAMPSQKDEYMEDMQENKKHFTYEKVKDLIEAHIAKCKSTTLTSVERRYFIIYDYEKKAALKAPTIEDIERALDTKETAITTCLTTCGNTVIRIDADKEDGPRHSTIDILYLFLCRKMARSIPLDNRAEQIRSDYMLKLGLDPDTDATPNIPLVHYISPLGIDLTMKDYMIIGGRYYKYFYIPSRGYAQNVPDSWLSRIAELDEGVDVDIQFIMQDAVRAKSKIVRTMRFQDAKVSTSDTHSTDAEELRGAQAGAQYIREAMAAGECLFNMITLITLSANTQVEIDRKYNRLKQELRDMDFQVTDNVWDYEDTFRSYIPGLYIGEDIYRKAKRNVTTSGAASCYPFTSLEVCDRKGIFMGENRMNNTMVILDLFNTKRYANANAILMGTTGSGKSYTMQGMAYHTYMRDKDRRVMIILPTKGAEFVRSCDAIGGEFVMVAPSSKTHMNIMDVRPVNRGDEAIIMGDTTYGDESWLLTKIKKVNKFISLIVEDYDDEYEYITDDVAIRTYKKYGITEDNDSIFTDATHTQVKEMPILQDLRDEYIAYSKSKDPNMLPSEKEKALLCAKKLRKYVEGSSRSFNNRTNVNLENHFIVFDLSSMGDEMGLGLFVVLDYVWNVIREDRTCKKHIFIDELWMFLMNKSGSRSKRMNALQESIVTDSVVEMVKIIRGHAGSLVVATQNLNDMDSLDNGTFGQAVLNNCKTKIILNIEETEIDQMTERLKLNANEIRQIRTSKQGNGMLIANNLKIPLRIVATEQEDILFNTDPNNLARIAEDIKKRCLETASERSSIENDS